MCLSERRDKDLDATDVKIPNIREYSLILYLSSGTDALSIYEHFAKSMILSHL